MCFTSTHILPSVNRKCAVNIRVLWHRSGMSKPGESGTILQVTSDHLPRRTMNVIVREHGEIEIQLLGRDGVLRKVDPVVIPEMLELLREAIDRPACFLCGYGKASGHSTGCKLYSLLARIDSE